MRLHTLLSRAGLPTDASADAAGGADVEILSVTDDSRTAGPGTLFIARPGVATDGAQFAQDAVAKGAVAVVSQSAIDGLAVPQVIVPDAAVAVSLLANAFYGNPSKFVKVIGVTGTNGKTTTAYLIRHILNELGYKCGMIGTVEIDDGKTQMPAEMTTPGAIELHRLLAAMRDNGCVACAMEVSSHALHQGRVSGIDFAGAGFTNLTGDHLDYHKTIDAYAEAKAELFNNLKDTAIAAVNVDSSASERMLAKTAARQATFAIENPTVDLHASHISVTSAGTRFRVNAGEKRQVDVEMKLVGRHNIENALCAMTLCCLVFALHLKKVAGALATASGAPGRLQPVTTSRPFAVLVDYAHTDDALQNVLSALRPITRGKLRVVFGCGGDRDRTKRPRMAKVAEQLADAVYVTSDNPRTEQPESILAEIRQGFSVKDKVAEEVDRRRAIYRAIGEAGPGDVVLIAGKGHENYQIIGKTKHHFDDVEEAAAALSAVNA